ncbi:MAG: hypothetical protein JKY25_03505 [Robiginitomaculum sp.]|nr:hypothetical protein [Robiginitomaculum sp.]
MTPKNSAKMVKLVAWGFIGFAFIWGLAPYQAVNAPSRMLLDLLDLPYGDAAPVLDRSQMWLSSIGAGLVVAISIMLLGIVAPAVAKSDKKTVQVTIWAFIGWYVVDGAGSVAAGVASNVIFNTVFLAAILAPLLLVKYEFTD